SASSERAISSLVPRESAMAPMNRRENERLMISHLPPGGCPPAAAASCPVICLLSPAMFRADFILGRASCFRMGKHAGFVLFSTYFAIIGFLRPQRIDGATSKQYR